MQHLSTDELGQLLFSQDERCRGEALRHLALRRGEEVVQHLSSALEDAAPGAFFFSLVEALGALMDERALPALTRAYLRARQDLPRLALLRAIGALPGQESEAFLLSSLQPTTPWPLQISTLEILLLRQQTNVLPHLLDAFVGSPLPEKLTKLLQKASLSHPEWRVAEAFTLRLLFIDPLSEEHLRAAIQALGEFGGSAAIPLIESWSAAIPALRRVSSLALRRLKRR